MLTDWVEGSTFQGLDPSLSIRLGLAEQKEGSSTSEASERHVGEKSVCMFGVAGAYCPSLGKAAPRRGCLLERNVV